MIDLTQVASAVITLIAVCITVKVIPLIKKKCNQEDLMRAAKWVEFAVKAAEQMAESGEIKKDNKFRWVMEFIESKGFNLNLGEIKTLIEAKVNELPKLLESLTVETCRAIDSTDQSKEE